MPSPLLLRKKGKKSERKREKNDKTHKRRYKKCIGNRAETGKTPLLRMTSPLMRLGTDPGLFGEMKALASCDVGVVDGYGGFVANVGHGVELAPLHMRTARSGFRWRLPCMHVCH